MPENDQNYKAMNTYEKQAQKFLKKTGTTLEIKFKKFGSMTWDKKGDKRNIFSINMYNKKGGYSFDFGASISDSQKQVPKIEINRKNIFYAGFKTESKISVGINVEMSTREIRDLSISEKYIHDLQEKIDEAEKKHKVNLPPANRILIDRVKSLRTELENQKDYASIQDEEIKKPTAYDILACLDVMYEDSFEDFCDSFGYDSDSISALNTYESVKEQSESLKDMFSEEELEMLHEIQ